MFAYILWLPCHAGLLSCAVFQQVWGHLQWASAIITVMLLQCFSTTCHGRKKKPLIIWRESVCTNCRNLFTYISSTSPPLMFKTDLLTKCGSLYVHVLLCLLSDKCIAFSSCFTLKASCRFCWWKTLQQQRLQFTLWSFWPLVSL